MFLALSCSAVGSAIQAGYDRVYSIQVATYKNPETGQLFAQQNSHIPFSCRVKNNGLFALYYGIYPNMGSAQEHLHDYAQLKDLGAYVVTLENVHFEPCLSLAEKIRNEQKEASQRRLCTDCSASELVNDYLNRGGPLASPEG